MPQRSLPKKLSRKGIEYYSFYFIILHRASEPQRASRRLSSHSAPSEIEEDPSTPLLLINVTALSQGKVRREKGVINDRALMESVISDIFLDEQFDEISEKRFEDGYASLWSHLFLNF
jgi:hypothetical protein